MDVGGGEVKPVLEGELDDAGTPGLETVDVLRALSNNALLATDSAGTRKILLGRGIGFGRQLGDHIDPSSASEVFIPDSQYPIAQLTAFISETPLAVIRVARRVVELAQERAGIRPSQSLLLGVADHLHFAVQRARQGIIVAYPLHWEVAQLYPREMAIGRTAVEVSSAEFGVPIPPEEATAFAMHLVNAEFASTDIGAAVAMTERISKIVAVVTAALGLTESVESMSVARFVTHLRYLVARTQSQTQITGCPPGLARLIHEDHTPAFELAQRVQTILELGGSPLTDAEILYLAMHIARLESTR